ncbi:MAG: VWA domain-containing protein, partial [Muribaculaceae bacterium]|nr:VWA domain-containing protein [Muribaculaceae bacterium]
MEKTTVFNLIILDESGSMIPLSEQTIEGCNETLNLIRSLEEKHGDSQRNLVSIYLFQGDSEVQSRYVYHNRPINEISNMNPDSYRPWGSTPLLDAVGSTLSELLTVAATHEDSTGIVTIITDGMENSSHEFSWGQ